MPESNEDPHQPQIVGKGSSKHRAPSLPGGSDALVIAVSVMLTRGQVAPVFVLKPHMLARWSAAING
jgi:hypothetical protein